MFYGLRRPTVDGRTKFLTATSPLLELLSQLVNPPRLHKHRACGMLAPNAVLRKAVIAELKPRIDALIRQPRKLAPAQISRARETCAGATRLP